MLSADKRAHAEVEAIVERPFEVSDIEEDAGASRPLGVVFYRVVDRDRAALRVSARRDGRRVHALIDGRAAVHAVPLDISIPRRERAFP